MNEEVYYRIFLGFNGLITVLEMQDFDENDYNQNRFYLDGNLKPMRWETEKEAIVFLNNRFKHEFIDPVYRSPNNRSYWKEMEN